MIDVFCPHDEQGKPARTANDCAILDVITLDRRWQFRVPKNQGDPDVWRAYIEVFRPTLAALIAVMT